MDLELHPAAGLGPGQGTTRAEDGRGREVLRLVTDAQTQSAGRLTLACETGVLGAPPPPASCTNAGGGGWGRLGRAPRCGGEGTGSRGASPARESVRQGGEAAGERPAPGWETAASDRPRAPACGRAACASPSPWDFDSWGSGGLGSWPLRCKSAPGPRRRGATSSLGGCDALSPLSHSGTPTRGTGFGNPWTAPAPTPVSVLSCLCGDPSEPPLSCTGLPRPPSPHISTGSLAGATRPSSALSLPQQVGPPPKRGELPADAQRTYKDSWSPGAPKRRIRSPPRRRGPGRDARPGPLARGLPVPPASSVPVPSAPQPPGSGTPEPRFPDPSPAPSTPDLQPPDPRPQAPAPRTPSPTSLLSSSPPTPRPRTPGPPDPRPQALDPRTAGPPDPRTPDPPAPAPLPRAPADSPSRLLASPAGLRAGPAHPNCSRYGRLRRCDTRGGRGPGMDMLGQQLPCGITVPGGEGRGRSQSPSSLPRPHPAPRLSSPGTRPPGATCAAGSPPGRGAVRSPTRTPPLGATGRHDPGPAGRGREDAARRNPAHSQSPPASGTDGPTGEAPGARWAGAPAGSALRVPAHPCASGGNLSAHPGAPESETKHTGKLQAQRGAPRAGAHSGGGPPPRAGAGPPGFPPRAGAPASTTRRCTPPLHLCSQISIHGGAGGSAPAFSPTVLGHVTPTAPQGPPGRSMAAAGRCYTCYTELLPPHLAPPGPPAPSRPLPRGARLWPAGNEHTF